MDNQLNFYNYISIYENYSVQSLIFSSFQRSFGKSQINKLIRSGANIIDIGGESTRPGSKDVNQKNEWNRVKETLKYLN